MNAMPALRFEENELTARDGTALFVRRAEVASPRANLLLIHGLGEHSARYLHVAEFFANRGITTWAWDLRGHGRSGGGRGRLDSYELLLEDVDTVWREVAKQTAPAFLYGHSLGGQIVLRYLERRKPRVRGAVIASPWLKLAFRPAPWKLLLARLALRVYPELTQNTGMRPERLSRDLAFLNSMRDLDLVHHRISARMFFLLQEGAEAAVRGASRLTDAILVVHGSADPVTSSEATEAFFQKAASRDKTLKIYPGALHEMHNDLNRTEVLADIADWIEARTAHPPE
jgi:acylglycerol lipase